MGFAVPPHAQVAATELVLETTIPALGDAALPEAQHRRRLQRHRVSRTPVRINNRHVPQLPTDLLDLLGVIGRVHQVVQRHNTLGGALGQGDRHLAVVERGQGRHHAHAIKLHARECHKMSPNATGLARFVQYRRRPGHPRRVCASVRARQKAQALAAVLLWHDDLTET